MIRRNRKHTQPGQTAKAAHTRGFALVVGLTLMAFILLLLLSLSTLLTVEVAATQQSKAQLIARENARLGLMVALGELQQAAGSDQRVSARAEILGDSVTGGNRYWTGIWNTTSPTANPVWLVSGDQLDPESTVGDVTLVGESSVRNTDLNADSANQVVRASLISNGSEGSYAWWVSDEGVKASIGVTGNEPIYPAPTISDQEGRREMGIYLSQGGSRVGTEVLVGGSFRQTAAGNQSALQRAVSGGDIALLDGVDEAFAVTHFHDLGVMSYGLLANTADGGLRMNLDNPLPGDPNDPFTNGDLDGYLDIATNMTTFNAGPLGTVRGLDARNQMAVGWDEGPNAIPTAPASGYRAYHHLSPIITEFAIYFSVYQRNAGGGSPGIRYYLDVELYNPYPFPIIMSANDLKPLTVMVEGLPEIRITQYSESGTQISNSGWVSIDSLTRSGTSLRETTSWLEITDTSNRSKSPHGILMPGEVYRLEDPDPTRQIGGLWKDMTGYYPRSVNDSDRIVVECRASSGGGDTEGRLTVKLVKGASAASGSPETRLPGDPSLFEVRNIPYDGDPSSFIYVYERADGRRPLGGGRFSAPDPKRYLQGSGSGTDVNVKDSYIFAFHYRVDGRPESPDLAKFLKYYDLRQPLMDYEDSFIFENEEGNQETIQFSDIISIASYNPISTENSLSLFLKSDLFNGGRVRYRDPEPASYDDRYADMRLYDVPAYRPTTIASIRHAYFVGMPPLSLTSPSGADLNRAFDRYFFSTVPSAGWEPGSGIALPNPRLRVSENTSATVADLRAHDSAASFIVEGAFNINSTSVAAWRAVLSQSSRDHSADGRNSEKFITRTAAEATPGARDLENYFFRLPYSGVDFNRALADAPSDGVVQGLFGLGELDLIRESNRQGMRSLNSADGNDQIHQLAYHIVREIKEYGYPFFSLADFINSGVVRRAIEEVGPAIPEAGIPAVRPINEGLYSYSPTYLRQTDIISSLASHMAARSDTFTIRSYGDYRNPVTGRVASKAMLEATVQRVPESLNGQDPMGNVERAFKVVSMRWIQE